MEDVLTNSDLGMARQQIIDLHQMINAEGARRGEQAAFRTDYANAWQAFRNAPTKGTARALLVIAPHLSEYFAKCAPGHKFYELEQFLKAKRAP